MNEIWMYKIHHIVTVMLHCFTAIHKSFPAASWDRKVSIECAPQNPGGNSRSSGHFLPTEFRHTTLLAYSFLHTK